MILSCASLIVADFPAPFAELYEKRFTLLWRGSRDGFGVRDFQDPCDEDRREGESNRLCFPRRPCLADISASDNCNANSDGRS
jgi:hypothetical protein